MSPAAPAKAAPAATPCVCCRARPHQGRPDADLDGYVCRACAARLAVAAQLLAAAGLAGCVPEPK